MLDLFLIGVICVIVIDLSGVIDSIKSAIKRLFTKGKMSDPNYSLKPIDCSFCMNFWCGLTYLLVTNTFSLWMITYVLLISVMTPVIKDVLLLVRDKLILLIKYFE